MRSTPVYRSPWQRFWTSPFTWLVMAVFFTVNTNYSDVKWNLNLWFLILTFYCWLRFYHYADARWGKP